MNKVPKVTVLMPVYNVEKYVQEAVESILNQTFGDFELLVLDDCSTDKTSEIVKSFADERIRYVKHERNLGLAENLNRGIELANTEYLARMDGDDICISTYLEDQINFLDRHPEIGICGGGLRFFGTKNSELIFPESHEDIVCEQLFGCSIMIPTFRRRIFIENNFRYKTSAFPAEDYRMWAEALRVTKLHNLQSVMYNYRMHAEQISTEKKQFQINKSNEVRLYMLEWLNPDFSEEEKKYFINVFVPGKIRNAEELLDLKNFASLLEKKNEKQHFNPLNLNRRLKKHLELSAYYGSLNIYFKDSFSFKNFMAYIKGGLASHVPFKLTVKIFLRSLFK